MNNQNNAHEISFALEGKPQQVTFIETVNVKDGVECDIYKFKDDTTKDLGILRIQPGSKTPLQKVLKGDRTIEGYISGIGKLVITKLDNSKVEYPVNDQTSKPFEIAVGVGENMQWIADAESSLTAYEICFPPYQEGRYKDLPE